MEGSEAGLCGEFSVNSLVSGKKLDHLQFSLAAGEVEKRHIIWGQGHINSGIRKKQCKFAVPLKQASAKGVVP